MGINYLLALCAYLILKIVKPEILNGFGIVLSVIELGIGIISIYGGIGLLAMSIQQKTAAQKIILRGNVIDD